MKAHIRRGLQSRSQNHVAPTSNEGSDGLCVPSHPLLPHIAHKGPPQLCSVTGAGFRDSSLLSSSDSSSREKVKRNKKNIKIKRKVADSITLPAWPEPQHFWIWKRKKVEKSDANLHTFTHSSPSWRSLETKLAAAEIAAECECTNQGRPMTGQAALFLFDAFKIEANAGALMDWTVH
eukprot:6492778-Amphidinium_carterae.5